MRPGVLNPDPGTRKPCDTKGQMSELRNAELPNVADDILFLSTSG